MYEAFVPKEIFLTKGIGRHKEKLASFSKENTGAFTALKGASR